MRVFEILDELIETVETAKGVPMSSSAVINRSVVLDLLDDLRDAFPTSLEDAREILEQRDEIVDSARAEAQRVQETSTSEARQLVESARAQAEREVSEASAAAEQARSRATAEADRLVGGARAESESIRSRARDNAERAVAGGRAERDRLVSQHEVHRTATAQAQQLLDDAQRNAGKLRGDADKYVESSLSDLSLTLQRLMTTVERGRDKLQSRQQSVGYEDDSFERPRSSIADEAPYAEGEVGPGVFDQDR
ncbi:DivIVA domain-containing protein [Epidermidibacterium keratini]|uniref:DivIVA domain-containing protein n=1 Tax=Epidermidibacterium keratini TaxID=1891644 RepID=A0A7L4YSQ8_9ACTN|nr:DivIVA domain-containing protein [Epidermidibacterium keratini]QHC01809.1 DivIVA domain-containing protein [Epidermidibacterium keratini]